MTKIKLTGTELTNLIKRVISEQETEYERNLKKMKGTGTKEDPFRGVPKTEDAINGKFYINPNGLYKFNGSKFEVHGKGTGEKGAAMKMDKYTLGKIESLTGKKLTEEEYKFWMGKPALMKNLIVLRPMLDRLVKDAAKIWTGCKKKGNCGGVEKALQKRMATIEKLFGSNLSTIATKSILFPEAGSAGKSVGGAAAVKTT
tara:strand:+ start:1571 stop:2173 length:603 start_codon:yes stop_codon:yes gene_type:complete